MLTRIVVGYQKVCASRQRSIENASRHYSCGNSAAIRIQKTALHALKLCVNDLVKLREESRRIVIELAGPGEYNLEELPVASRPRTYPEQ